MMLTNCLNCGAKKSASATCEKCGWDNPMPSPPVHLMKGPRLDPGIHWASILSLLLSVPLLLDGGLAMFTSRPKEEIGVVLEATLFLWMLLFIPAIFLAI